MTDTDILVSAIAALVALLGGGLSVFTGNLAQAGIVIGRALTTEIDVKNSAKISLLSVVRPSVKVHHWLMMTLLLQVPKMILVVGGLFSYFYFFRIGGLVFLIIYLAGMFVNKITTNEFRYYLRYYTDWLTRLMKSYERSGDTPKVTSINTLLVNLNKMLAIYNYSDVNVPGKVTVALFPFGDMLYLKKSNPLHFRDEIEKIVAANKAKAKIG